MNWPEFLLAIGLIILVTILYFILRKFISWAIEDDNKFHKKRGGGLSKDTLKVNKQIAWDRLTYGYVVILFALVSYIVKLISDCL